jgi:hypothetical protein
MGASSTRRLVCLSSAGLEIAPDISFAQRMVTRLVIQRMYRYGYEDMVRMEGLLHETDARWTVVRCPMLTDRPGTGDYRTAIDGHVPDARSIGRADLAHYLLSAIGDAKTWKKTVEISR